MSLYAERTVVENRRKGDVGERAGDDWQAEVLELRGRDPVYNGGIGRKQDQTPGPLSQEEEQRMYIQIWQ